MNIELKQGWDNLDEIIDYLLDLVLELHAFKRHPHLPTELYLHIDTGDDKLDEKVINADTKIILESLS